MSQGAFQASLFDERDLAEVSPPDHPGERLVVCRNPLLANGDGYTNLEEWLHEFAAEVESR